MVWGRFKRLVKGVRSRLAVRFPARSRQGAAINNPYPIATPGSTPESAVDAYWGDYTIKSDPFVSGQEHLDWLQWRSDHVHLSYSFKGLWNSHNGETMLDYGCGPGNDLVGFLVYSKPAKIFAIDISYKALSLAGHNVGLHKIPADQLSLIQVRDLSDRIPLPDASIDYVHSMGVLHHTSNPEQILREFRRILKPSGRAAVMLYHKDSLCYHLYAAYVRMIVETPYPGCEVDEVFHRSTDGPECPISRCYQPSEVCEMAQNAGFQCEFVGGFVASNEIDLWNMHGAQALRDSRLGDSHKAFLRELHWDDQGLPFYRGKHAGIGGVYRLT